MSLRSFFLRPPFTIAGLFLCFIACNSPQAEPSTESPVRTQTETSSSQEIPQQLIVVTTTDWSTPYGQLQRYEGRAHNWQSIGPTFDVQIGKKGLGWGIGELAIDSLEGPIKKEGDLKSPAGVFTLGEGFGYPEQIDGLQWPYHPITAQTMCIEDGQSQAYNRLIEADQTISDWKSTDLMQRTDDLYKYGVFVNHNTEPIPGGGSCIFLHIWRSGGNGTAGCTAMEMGHMLTLLKWLQSEAQPLLVQMPSDVYAQMAPSFGWPQPKK